MVLVLTKSFKNNVLFWDKNQLKTTLENGKFGLIDASAA
jgi:predicted kinase